VDENRGSGLVPPKKQVDHFDKSEDRENGEKNAGKDGGGKKPRENDGNIYLKTMIDKIGKKERSQPTRIWGTRD